MCERMRFIYAFDEQTCDILRSKGYRELKKSGDGIITVFENKDELTYEDMPDCQCVYSNVLTF